MCYDLADGELTPDKLNQLEAELKAWAIATCYGDRVAKNICRERFLDKAAYVEMLRFIVGESGTERLVFQERFDVRCRLHKRKGGKARFTVKPLLFGCAIEMAAFEYHLTTNYRSRFGTPTHARDFIDRLTTRDFLFGEKDIEMKAHGIWTTWNEEDHTKEPFHFCNTAEANEVRANLGLFRHYKDQPLDRLLIFIYPISDSIPLYRPAFTDAGLNEYWEQPIAGHDDYGRTVPWPRDASMKGFALNSRPEAVHEPVPIGLLERDVNIRV
jgi:hypothetical protein